MRNDAILGNIPEFSYNENLKIDDIKINFDLDKSVVNSYNDKYKDISEELSGIKRFNVFRYFEDTNMLLPIETFHDEAAGRVYAHTTETGTYCLIDMAAWLDSLGFAEYTARAERSVMTYSAEKSAGNDIDIIFILHSTTVYADFIKDELTNFIDSAYSHADSVHMYFVSNGGDVYMINGREYAETAEECKTILGRFKGSSASVNVNKGFAAARNLELRDGSQRHMFLLDGCSEPTCGEANGNLNEILKKGVNFGIVCNIANSNVMNYRLLSNYNVRENIIVFKDFMLNQIDFTDITEEEYIITANGLVPMPEDFGDISIDSEKDYDNDDLLDVQEIYFDVTDKEGNTLITVNDDGSVVLPSFNECVEAGGTYVESGLKRFYDEADNDIMEFLDIIKVLPIFSDPTSEDGDGDGILDSVEYNIIQKYSGGGTEYLTSYEISEDSDGCFLDLLSSDSIEKYGFNTGITEKILNKDEGNIKESYTLAREKGLVAGATNYGVLGDDTDVFYLEAYCEYDSDGKIISNELRINANVYCLNESMILCDKEKTKVSKQDLFEAICKKWGKTYEGSEYDFFGMNVNVSVVLHEVSKVNTSSAGILINSKRKINYTDGTPSVETDYKGRYFQIHLHNAVSDERGNHTHVDLKNKPIVCLYREVQRDKTKDPEKPNKERFCASGAHEFGHVLGIMDAYGKYSTENYFIEPISHAEIVYDSSGPVGVETSGEMMHRSGVVSANDIEMVLFARMTGELQYFVPIHRRSGESSTEYGLSPAIRAEYEYRAGQDFDKISSIFSSEDEKIYLGQKFVYNKATLKYDKKVEK